MSLYSFFPMKKRKTQNVGTRRSASTLGKLKKSSDSPSAAGNGIEILWDNNSPSPTTTITLAGKRRRRQNTRTEEESSITDVSFIVQKLSENTSPVVDEGRSVLLEMWHQNEADQRNTSEFTSPPLRQTQYKKTPSPLSTPFIQRRTSKRQSRKATKQFMLEIRKLVDEIQKSDLSGSSESQKEIQCKITEDQAPVKRPKKNESKMTVTPSTQTKQAFIPGTTKFDSKSAISEPKPAISELGPALSDPAISDCLLEDSFEWTEDDMDELILTCQLSSSGKGSLTVPDAPRPQCGLSPSQIFVPETQIAQMPPEIEPCLQSTQVLLHEEEPEVNTNEDVPILNTNCGGKLYEQEVPVQNDLDKWELNFDEDDSLLASAAQEFELSQEAGAKDESPKQQRENIDGFSLGEQPTCGENDYNCQKLLTDTLPVSGNLTTDGGFAKRSPRNENENNKSSIGKSTLKESSQNVLPTTRSSSQFTKITNHSSSKKLDDSPPRNSRHEKNISKLVEENAASLGGNFLEKGNFSTIGTVDVSCDSIATPRQRTKTKLTLQRTSTPCPNKSSASSKMRANENHYSRNNVWSQSRVNDALSAPLQSGPGSTASPAKHPRLLTNLKISTEACSKQTMAKNCSYVNTTLNESKPNGMSVKECVSRECKARECKARECKARECKASLSQNKEEQSNKVQENAIDFLLCEDDVAALLDDFNFDDVLTGAAPKSTNHVPKPCTNISTPVLSTVTQKRYSKDEIERKRVEAQRRRLAKIKQKNSTQLTCSRISKR